MTEVPADIIAASIYSDEAAISTYGISCASHDNDPGTPWYSYCTAANFCTGPDFENGDDNWCAAPWCYVQDPTACAAAGGAPVPTSVFEDAAGDALQYSYLTCGAPDCYGGWAEGVESGECPYTEPADVDACCAATQVANSDKSATGSIGGSTGDTVTVTCDPGYSGGGTATCGTDGTFNALTCAEDEEESESESEEEESESEEEDSPAAISLPGQPLLLAAIATVTAALWAA